MIVQLLKEKLFYISNVHLKKILLRSTNVPMKKLINIFDGDF